MEQKQPEHVTAGKRLKQEKHCQTSAERKAAEKCPTIDMRKLLLMSERGRKDALLNHYSHLRQYQLSRWTNEYIQQQERRTDDLYRRLHRIRHGGMSDSRSPSERRRDFNVERAKDDIHEIPVEIQMIRAIKEEKKREMENGIGTLTTYSDSSSTHPSLMEVKGEWERRQLHAGRTPKTCENDVKPIRKS